jgi:hypothetical protein
VMHRFLVQAFQDPPFCSSTVYTTRTQLHLDMPEDASHMPAAEGHQQHQEH